MELSQSLLIHILVIHFLLVAKVDGQARLIDPPSRSAMWRYGFGTPRNINDNRLNCGGIGVLKSNDGECGLCGDPINSRRPRANEDGGRFAKRVISRTYKQAEAVDFTIELRRGEKGYFEFRLCDLSEGVFEATQECLNRHLLEMANGTTRISVSQSRNTNTTFRLMLPKEITCQRCVVQWTYVTAHIWGCNSNPRKCCFGCGVQEKYVNCADVTIEPLQTTTISTTTTTTTTTTAATTTLLTTPDVTTLPPTTQSVQAPAVQPTSSSQSGQSSPSDQSSAQQAHIRELLEAQKAQLEELARLRLEMEEMSRKTTPPTIETTTVATDNASTSEDPQKMKEFVSAFLNVVRTYHGNSPPTSNALMNILDNPRLFQSPTTTPAPTGLPSFLSGMLIPDSQQQTPPKPAPSQAAVPSISSQFPTALAQQNAYPSVFQNPISNYQQAALTNQYMGMNPETMQNTAAEQQLFDMQSVGSPLLEMGAGNELGAGGVFSPAIMAQMLAAALPQQSAALPSQAAALPPQPAPLPPRTTTKPVQQPPKPTTTPPTVEPAEQSKLLVPSTAYLGMIQKKPLTIRDLNKAQLSEILLKLKIANIVMTRKQPLLSDASKVRTYNMIIDNAMKVLNEKRKAEINKAAPLVLTEMTQNQQLLKQKKEIENLREQITKITKLVAMQEARPTTTPPPPPTTPSPPMTESQLLGTIFGVQKPPPRPVSKPRHSPVRNPSGMPDAIHPMHSKPVNFNQMDPFSLMTMNFGTGNGMGMMGGMGGMAAIPGMGALMDTLGKCEYFGVAEIEWPCRRYCVPDPTLACTARPNFPQHRNRCAMECTVM